MEHLLSNKQMSAPADRFTLAKLYLAVKNWTKARELLRSMAGKSSDLPAEVMATYIGELLQHDELSDAEMMLETLEKAAPEHFRSLSLRAEDRVRRGQPDQALEILMKFAEKPDAPPAELQDRRRLAAECLEKLAAQLKASKRPQPAAHFLEKAKSLYDLYVEQRPQEILLLAAFLARHEKLDNALDLIRESGPAVPMDVAQAVQLVVENDPSPKQLNKAEEILQNVLKKNDHFAPLLMVEANLCTAQSSRQDDAEQCYRELLAKDPDQAVSLNNLANLLALRQIKVSEALQLINHAITVAGPMASMLDTRRGGLPGRQRAGEGRKGHGRPKGRTFR